MMAAGMIKKECEAVARDIFCISEKKLVTSALQNGNTLMRSRYASISSGVEPKREASDNHFAQASIASVQHLLCKDYAPSRNFRLMLITSYSSEYRYMKMARRIHPDCQVDYYYKCLNINRMAASSILPRHKPFLELFKHTIYKTSLNRL